MRVLTYSLQFFELCTRKKEKYELNQSLHACMVSQTCEWLVEFELMESSNKLLGTAVYIAYTS